jgi:murein DD-endopeptidase
VAKYTFSSSRRSSGTTRALGAVLALSLALNLYLLFFRGGPEDGADTAPAEDAVDADASEATPPVTAEDGEAADATPAEVATEVSGEPVGEFEQLLGLDLEVNGSLSQLFDTAVEGRRSVWLTATSSRILMWCLNLQKDMRAGDRLRLLYEPQGDDQVQIAALHYVSQKKGREYTAYYFTPKGEEWGSYFDSDGAEVPSRLKETPIRDYQEITSVLGDGRNHKGYDFRAPVGTPVHAVKQAKVLRTTWNFKYNGNSLELRYGDGTIARYLHLEALASTVKAGGTVEAGQQVATSGNTGRSNAPHLHYELEKSGRVVDPVDYHGEARRTVGAADKERFSAAVTAYEAAFERIVPAGEGT